MMTKVVFLPPSLALLLLLWFLFSPPIRPIPSLVAIGVVALGGWLQIEGDRYSMTWLAGLLIHIVFSGVMILRRQSESF